MTGLFDKLRIKPEIIKSAPLKAQPNPFEPFSPSAREATRQDSTLRALVGPRWFTHHVEQFYSTH